MITEGRGEREADIEMERRERLIIGWVGEKGLYWNEEERRVNNGMERRERMIMEWEVEDAYLKKEGGRRGRK